MEFPKTHTVIIVHACGLCKISIPCLFIIVVIVVVFNLHVFEILHKFCFHAVVYILIVSAPLSQFCIQVAIHVKIDKYAKFDLNLPFCLRVMSIFTN